MYFGIKQHKMNIDTYMDHVYSCVTSNQVYYYSSSQNSTKLVSTWADHHIPSDLNALCTRHIIGIIQLNTSSTSISSIQSHTLHKIHQTYFGRTFSSTKSQIIYFGSSRDNKVIQSSSNLREKVLYFILASRNLFILLIWTSH